MSVNDINPISNVNLSSNLDKKATSSINNTTSKPHLNNGKQNINIPSSSRNNEIPTNANSHSIPVRASVKSATNGLKLPGRTNATGIDPQRLFELVSKNYETWQQAIHKQFQDEDNFSPFPNEDDEDKHFDVLKNNLKNNNFKDSEPIFDYSLLEALEKASFEFTDNINQLESKGSTSKARSSGSGSLGASFDPITEVTNQINKASKSLTKNNSLLNENEIDFLREKISQMLNSNHQLSGAPKKRKQGFSLYDTQDEEGLHEENTDQFYDNEEYDDNEDEEDYDYDLDEVDDDDGYLPYKHPTHHIEVELNTGECPVHGIDDCDCSLYEYDDEGHELDDNVDGPSCEFTFEYDHTGKLVPTYNNVEEKLRLMSLQSRLSNAAAFAKANGVNLGADNNNINNINGKSMRLPSINSLDIGNAANSTKSKSSKKKKKKSKNKNHDETSSESKVDEKITNFIKGGEDQCCLLCEYQAIYGVKPRQMIKSYNKRISGDEKRREELRKKLDNVKQKAQRRQRELRDKQLKKQEQLKQQQHLQEQHRKQQMIQKEQEKQQQKDNEVIANFIDAAANTVD